MQLTCCVVHIKMHEQPRLSTDHRLQQISLWRGSHDI